MKIAMTVFAAVLALAAVAQGEGAAKAPIGAKARPARAMMGPGGMADPVVRAALNPKVAEKLGLSEDQLARLKALEDEKGGAKELQAKVRQGMEKQAELLKQEKIDESAVMAALDEVWEARKELAKRQTRRLIAVKAILTPEQIKEATELMKTFRAKKGDGKNPGAVRPKKAKKGEKKAEKPQE